MSWSSTLRTRVAGLPVGITLISRGKAISSYRVVIVVYFGPLTAMPPRLRSVNTALGVDGLFPCCSSPIWKVVKARLRSLKSRTVESAWGGYTGPASETAFVVCRAPPRNFR